MTEMNQKKDEGITDFFEALRYWWRIRPKRINCEGCGRVLWMCVEKLDAPPFCSYECVEETIGPIEPMGQSGGYIPF